MKWNKPEIGNIRIKKRFALFPITIKGETRWLEFVKIRQEFCINFQSLTPRWRDTSFIDDDMKMGINEYMEKSVHEKSQKSKHKKSWRVPVKKGKSI